MIGIVGLLVGLLLGILLNIKIPPDYAVYISIALLSGLSSIFYGIKSKLINKFDSSEFLYGFIGDTFLAIILTFIGDKIGMPLYLISIIVFGSRIFNNFYNIRKNFKIKIMENNKNEIK